MPTPNRIATTEAAPSENYTILDKDVEQINGVNITKDHHKKGIDLTAAEALSYIASGTISLSDGEESKGKAAKAITQHPAGQTATKEAPKASAD